MGLVFATGTDGEVDSCTDGIDSRKAAGLLEAGGSSDPHPDIPDAMITTNKIAAMAFEIVCFRIFSPNPFYILQL